jgi:hypothetical protein
MLQLWHHQIENSNKYYREVKTNVFIEYAKVEQHFASE